MTIFGERTPGGESDRPVYIDDELVASAGGCRLTRLERMASWWSHHGITGVKVARATADGLLLAVLWGTRSGNPFTITQAALWRFVGVMVGVMLLAMAVTVVADRVHDRLHYGELTRCRRCCCAWDGDEESGAAGDGGAS